MDFDFSPFMQEALRLAAKARGHTAPNPMVGAILLSENNEVLGRGFHHRAGEPHAEVMAIRDALENGSEISGTTLVVTLEPCNHQGRTPPCTDLIISKRIKKVIVGAKDPYKLMQGKSLEILKKNNIEVVSGVLPEECEKLVRGFRTVLQESRPFVTIKCATSLDGKIATITGESKWITDEPARLMAHEERNQHDAILVGVGTVLADDPQLNIRLASKSKPLKKIILDSRLVTPSTARLFKSEGTVTIYCDPDYSSERKKELESVGAIIIPIASSKKFSQPGFLDLQTVLEDLAKRGIQELLVEGGARVLGAFVREKLFDRVVYFVAPKILGSSSQDVFEGVQIEHLSESIKIENLSARLVGKDILIEGIRSCSPDS